MADPKKGVAYTFARGLYDMAAGGKLKVNPTIAAGDFKLSTNFGTPVNLTTLPTVTPAGGVMVQFTFTASETNANDLTLIGVDQAGNEWGDYVEHFKPVSQTVEDLPTALQMADAVLTRDWMVVAGPPPAYSVWNALRHLRNAWALVAGTPPQLHVKTEDGSTDAWVRNVTTDTAAQPITGVQ